MAGFVKGSKEHESHLRRMQTDIGRVRNLNDKGYSIEDIVIKTNLNEATVRNYLNIIAGAEANRNKDK